MIHELLRPDHIHLDVRGPFEAVLRRMVAGLPHGEQVMQGLEPLLEEPDTLLLLPSDDVVLPHFRMAGIEAPQLVLGISRRGIACHGKSPSIVLFLVSPEEDTAGHLKLLQRLSALLPELAKRLAAARSADQAIRILAEGEQHSLRPTFLNITQDQVALELRSDLSAGLSLHSPNLIRKKRRVPWHLKLLRNFFSFGSTRMNVKKVLEVPFCRTFSAD